MKQKETLVSVVMPVYNAGRFLDLAILSIMNQTYQNLELIIVNDASSDNSAKIIAKYKKLYSRKIKVVTLTQNVNRGGDAAGNIGYSLAKGKYIARMDSDDIALPTRLAKQVEYMEANKDVSVLGTQAEVIDINGVVVGVKKMPTSHELIEREFFTFHPLIHPTVMVRKSAIKRKKLYLTDYHANNDYLTFFTLLMQGKKMANLSESLLQYRVHGDNDSLAHVKHNFINSLKIRSRAVFVMGYRPSLLSVMKLLAQSVLVFVLPEKVTVELYYLVRGIKKWSNLWEYPNLGSVAKMKAYVQAMVAGIFTTLR